MNLYLISQDANEDYDTYDSAVVCAASEGEARNIHPMGGYVNWSEAAAYRLSSIWCWEPSEVNVEFIGQADDDVPVGVVLASFNAG